MKVTKPTKTQIKKAAEKMAEIRKKMTESKNKKDSENQNVEETESNNEKDSENQNVEETE